MKTLFKKLSRCFMACALLALSIGGVMTVCASNDVTTVTLPDVEPVAAGMKFAGYKLNGDEGKLYQAGDQVVIDMALANGSTELTFEAVYKEAVDVKYAVAIYGINQDIDQSGKLIPLTFGPATGKSYVDTYNACPGTSEASPTYNGHKCLHWMSWEEITEQADTDPTVFMDCLKNGCTHSVKLNFGDSPLKTTYQYPDMSGDGATILYTSMKSSYRMWNNVADNKGGWPVSRIRTTLNGSDKCEDTDPSVAGMNLLTESQALISAFPEELRNAIVPKAVKSDVVYDSEDAGNVKTTYDKLWLFSGRELRTGNPENDVRKNESNVSTGYYQRASELDISTSSYANLKGYNESGFADYWLLRSLNRNYPGSVYGVNITSDWNYYSADDWNGGVAPGFCIGTPKEIPVDVKYAVAIYGINQDTGQMTFGPATGKSYVDTYNACPGTSEASPTYNGHKCLHWMSWEEIIEQANTDPTVFMDCLKNGCTHSVNLYFGDSPLKGDNTYSDMSGDGASIPYDSLNESYRKWNKIRSSTGGWPASRIRTTLNGSDKCEDTDSSVAGTDLLTESQALISAFPEELRNAIVPKVAYSDIIYNREDINYIRGTLDKLWLFSTTEIYKPGSETSGFIRDDEGLYGSNTKYYMRAENMNFMTDTDFARQIGYIESGSAGGWWLRSLTWSFPDTVHRVGSLGRCDYQGETSSSSHIGLAPGFCIGTPK